MTDAKKPTTAAATASGFGDFPNPATRNPYDIHFYYTLQTKTSALAIRESLSKAFNWLRFFDPNDEPIGPHPVGMWEADFKNSKDIKSDFGAVVNWLMLNRGAHSVLIHPHTYKGGLVDHTAHALWLGPQLPLITSIFSD